MKKELFLSLLLASQLFGEDVDELLSEFDDTPTKVKKVKKTKKEIVKSSDSKTDELLNGFDDSDIDSKKEEKKTKVSKDSRDFRGSFTQSLNYSYKGKTPHFGLTSLKSKLFLEYNKKLNENFKLKINANAFYDSLYSLRGREKYTKEELHSLESEVELYDFFIQGSLSDNLDIKLGRQVVVWGRSDNIRVVDVLNPLDFRRPGMVDIEDLRLPLGMVKFDYYLSENWRVTPIIIAEQRENKNPPFGSEFYPAPSKLPSQTMPHKTTYALDIGGEFSGYDVDFYFADVIMPDEFGMPNYKRKKAKMYALAFNYVSGSWLFKGELASKRDLEFVGVSGKFKRVDALVGVEYNGISDTKISYDFSKKSFNKKTPLFDKNIYQHSLRVTSDFLNSTLHANYLVTLFGKNADDGGFQRAWIKYDIKDALSSNIGVVDYIGGSQKLDKIKDNDIFFIDIVYSF